MKVCPDIRNSRGLTLIELIVALGVLAVLASAVLPLAEVTVKRSRELELRRSLRVVRSAIDAYKTDFDKAVTEGKINKAVNESGYPPDLEILVKGRDFGGLYPFPKKYLRRIPRDPFDSYEMGWGLRAYGDEPDSNIYGGGDVYDVYSQSDETGLDGTAYRTW